MAVAFPGFSRRDSAIRVIMPKSLHEILAELGVATGYLLNSQDWTIDGKNLSSTPLAVLVSLPERARMIPSVLIAATASKLNYLTKRPGFFSPTRHSVSREQQSRKRNCPFRFLYSKWLRRRQSPIRSKNCSIGFSAATSTSNSYVCCDYTSLVTLPQLVSPPTSPNHVWSRLQLRTNPKIGSWRATQSCLWSWYNLVCQWNPLLSVSKIRHLRGRSCIPVFPIYSSPFCFHYSIQEPRRR